LYNKCLVTLFQRTAHSADIGFIPSSSTLGVIFRHSTVPCIYCT